MTANLMVPGDWSVVRAHVLTDELEGALSSALPHLRCILHIEPGSHQQAPAP